MIVNDVKVIYPPNLGWLEKKLSTEEMNHLWKCIDKRKESMKNTLAGNIHESNKIIDEDDWFWKNTVGPLCQIYANQFGNIGEKIPTNQNHPYFLQKMWVNYQKQNEFNPAHNHTGVYSFVIWMKIPTKHSEQNQNPISSKSNTPLISSFQFHYVDILGGWQERSYSMDPEVEGTMLFFPAKLLHQVYPFLNCEEDRISISGNVSLDTKKLL